MKPTNMIRSTVLTNLIQSKSQPLKIKILNLLRSRRHSSKKRTITVKNLRKRRAKRPRKRLLSKLR